MMKTIAVSELRSNLMKVLKEIEHGSSLDVTSRGKVVARLVPPDYAMKLARSKLNELGKRAKIHDIISPIGVNWEADN
jgi:prevent-host-death family protein